MEEQKTKEQKEATVIINLYTRHRNLKSACGKLVNYIHEKYPGEEILCPHLKKIAKLIKDD